MRPVAYFLGISIILRNVTKGRDNFSFDQKRPQIAKSLETGERRIICETKGADGVLGGLE